MMNWWARWQKRSRALWAQQRFIKDRHPVLHPSVGGEDGRTAGMPFDQQIIEVGSSLAGKLLEAEIVHHQEVGADGLRERG